MYNSLKKYRQKQYLMTLVIKDGDVWDGVQPRFNGYVVVEGNIIKETGKMESFNEKRYPNAKIIDAAKGTVLPAFTDAHIHVMSYPLIKNGVHMGPFKSSKECIQALEEKAKQSKPGEWVYGSMYNENNHSDKRILTKADIDYIKSPVLVTRCCFHIAMVNQAALDLVDLSKIDEKYIRRDSNGNIIGQFKDSGMIPFVKLVSKAMSDKTDFQVLFKDVLSYGLAELHTIGASLIGTPEGTSLYQKFRKEGKLPIRIVVYPDSRPSFDMSTGFGDEFIRYGGYKIFLDGSLGGRTAAVSEEYCDRPGEKGYLLMSDNEVIEIIRYCTENDIALQAHAIGDVAIEQIVRLCEIAYKEKKPRIPIKISHCEICPPELVKRIGALKGIPDTQPNDTMCDQEIIREGLGNVRGSWCFALRSMIDAGCTVISSSDWPVAPYNPLCAIKGAVWRGEWNMEQAITLDEALKSHTYNPQVAVGFENRKGTLRSGMLADIAIFDRSLFEVNPKDLLECKVTHTIVDGKVAFERAK